MRSVARSDSPKTLAVNHVVLWFGVCTEANLLARERGIGVKLSGMGL